MSKSLGVLYTVFNEKNAVDFSIKKLKEVYPDIPVYLVSDGGHDFSYLENEYTNIKANMDVDTMGATFKITDKNFKEEVHQKSMKKCSLAVLERLDKCIEYCNTDYILMMDPDTLVRGELNIPDGAKLLGSRINKGFPDKFKKTLTKVPGGISINHWGATPAIFEVESFKKAYSVLKDNMDVYDELCMSFYAMYAHDVLLPTLYALIGIEETFNPNIVECSRNKNWKKTTHPLVHQFKEYY